MIHILKFSKAVSALQPNAKFSAKNIDENNSEITGWFDDTIPQPSPSEINNKINELEIQYEQDKINKANKKASGKQKLKDLGLDDDEIQALMGA